MHLTLLQSLVLLSSSATNLLVSALPTTTSSPAAVEAKFPVRTVYQYPTNDTWIENLAVMANGSILLTTVENPMGLFMIDPLAAKPVPRLVHRFPGLNTTSGIVETTPGTFYVGVSNGSLATLDGQAGTGHIYRVVFPQSGAAPAVSLVSHVKSAQLINGLVALNSSLILFADSHQGVVYSVDTTTGISKIVIKNEPLFTSDPREPVGVDGLKIVNGTLYFTNAWQALIGKVEINPDGTAKGPAAKVAGSVPGGQYDDFAFDANGVFAYGATGAGNSVAKVNPANGQVMAIAGSTSSTQIDEPTAVAFGRTAKDSNVLYVTTGGGLGETAERPAIGAQLVAVTLS